MLTKHYIILLLSLVLGCASCQWHEAEAVIAMADSIDQTQHVIYDDTAALGLVIRQLDNPMGRVFKHSTLGKAYYYMGRNLADNHQQIAEAAKCYIEADRLHIDDPIYRGRVNSCMGYICRQNNNDSLALFFYERASQDFKESGNEMRYALNILDLCEININLRNYDVAETHLQIASGYQLDSAYRAYYYETRGIYFYEQQLFDSALIYFNQALNYWHSEEEKCFSYLKIMQTYYWGHKEIKKTLQYAHMIISKSNNPNYLINAYYCMMLDAKTNNDTQLLSQYAHAREDANRLFKKHKSSYDIAQAMLQKYLEHPNPWRWIWIALVLLMFVCLLSIVAVIVYRKRTVSAYIKMDALSIHLKEQEDVVLELKHIQDCEKLTNKIRAKYPTPLNAWNDYTMLKKDLNPYLYNFLNALEDWKLTNREKVFCVFIFIYRHLPISEVADYMNITDRAVRVLKTRVAQKLGITSIELIDYLQKLTNAD